MFWNPFILSASLLISSFTLFNDPLILFVPRWRTTASVSSHIYPFNLGIKCSILIPNVLYTHTASGLSSFGFNCLASPRILESPMIHFFFFDLTTGICLVTFALSSLSDRSLMVSVKSLLLLLLVVLLHSVEPMSLLFFSLFLTFWLSKSFLFGFSFIYFGAFFNCAFLSGLFFPIFIFYHFLAYRRCSFSTSIYCSLIVSVKNVSLRQYTSSDGLSLTKKNLNWSSLFNNLFIL